ncbi:ABC transporter substrate-binding protein [Streptomyces sp. A3M-1-3]|uniref:ABC transporter substrate-binding protein n=1 Tax=Streptomyces sp. A3M-1-3 TaxID=2962044 RepID=UPI0020B6EBE8|nr:ABC transporter substrate-binding protein [Streptomyces sp. A3M-1-3]MCP3818908.1 ABC transporter substrate-binding protein [Streptomyces sp. A3M-1-3]
MRSVQFRVFTAGVVLAAVGIGAWQLVPSDGVRNDPITVGTTDTVSSLDPAGAYDAGSWALYSNVFQTLMTMRPGSDTPVPDAADSCGFVGQKLTTYECELREGLTFSNGREVTAADVKHSFDRVLEIDSEQGPKPLFATLKSVRTRGSTITFNLSSRDATFPFKVATGAGSIVDREKYPAKELRTGDGVDGSGPYVLTSFDADSRAELKPNTSYEGQASAAHVPVTIRYFQESEELERAWKSHGVDVTHREMPPKVLAGLTPGLPDIRIQESEGAEIRTLIFNVRKGSQMARKGVRKAVAAVLDRPRLANSVYHGTVDPLYSLIPQGIGGHSTPFFDAYPEPSRDRARTLLREAGVRTPVRFSLAFSVRGATKAEAEEMRRQLEDTGLFEVKLIAVPEWTTFQKGYAAGKYDAYTIGWIADFPDPDNFSQPLVGTNTSMNNGFSDKEIDELIVKTQSYGERGRASKDFKTLQRLVADEVPMVPLWQKKDYVLSREAVTGAQYLSDGTGVWRLWELNWL